MIGSGGGPRAGAVTDDPRHLVRWECRCQSPPVLLATHDADGCIHIKVRDRYWHIHGVVRTVCPRCGSEHVLDLPVGSRESEVGGEREAPANIVRFPTPDP